MSVYYGKNGEMRFYDGTATPNYIILRFSEMNLQVAEGAARPDEMIRLNRGQLDANAHYIQGLDDSILNPIPMSTSIRLESGTNKDLLHEFIALRFASGQQVTWVAGSLATVLVTTKGTTQRPAGLTGTLVTTPLFTDPKKKCVNSLGLWDDLNSSKIGRKLSETYFPPAEQALNEAPDGILVNLSGQVYGEIRSITVFPAGTNIT